MGHDIYVDPNTGTNSNSSNCWNGEVPCSTIELGLEGLQHFNHTTLWVTATPEDYVIQKPVKFEFVNMGNIAIIIKSSSGGSFVTVNCVKEMGLTFHYSKNITLRGIRLNGCGALQVSTSKNFSTHNYYSDNKFRFATFYTTLYFLYCEDVHLQTVTVINGKGIGAVFYSTVGKNKIDSSYFSNNTALKTPHMPGGGGLYIEFSYCTPTLNDVIANNNCSESNVPGHFSQNAEYLVIDSVFSRNNASVVDTNQHTFILPQKGNHIAFGRGGGVSVYFKGNSSNNTMLLSNCTILNNTALWGAGLFIEYQDSTHYNQITIKDSSISFNQVLDSTSESGTRGGGARVGYIFFDKTHSHRNLMSFVNVTFTGNRAYYGGGLSFYTAREHSADATNQLIFKSCSWKNNIARVGTAVDLSVWHPVSTGAVVKPSFSRCIFRNNSADYAENNSSGTFVGLGAMYTDSIPILFTDNVNFSHNTHTALAAVGTGIYFDSNTVAVFYSNTGRNGGALALMGYAFIEVSENTKLYFKKNFAFLRGGAIYGYLIGEHDLISSRNCIIRYKDIRLTPPEWNTMFYFEENKARNKINSIFVTSLMTCFWGAAFGPKLGGTSEVFCWNDQNLTRWKYTTGNCSENIATSPAKFTPSGNLSYDLTDNTYNLKMIPGKRETLPFSAVDDQGFDVTNDTVLIAQLKESEKSLFLETRSVYITSDSVEVHGNVNTTGILTIETIDPRVISAQINVKVLDCPPGMFLDSNGTCVCRFGFNSLLKCYQNNFTTQLRRGAWIGIGESGALVGQCPYCAAIGSSRYINLPTNPQKLKAELCEKVHRTATLCGKCKPTYGPSINSIDFQCIKCGNDDARYGWVLYLLTQFLPITMFFLLVFVIDIGVTAGPANAYVFFAQMVTTAIVLDGDGWIQVDDVFTGGSVVDKLFRIFPYSIWNLDFQPYFPKFCLSTNISTLQLLAIGYIMALFPLVLVGIALFISYLDERGCKLVTCLCEPLKRCYTKIKKSTRSEFKLHILHAFATFILLSYTKFTEVSFILLTSTPLLYDNGSVQSNRLYFDGDIVFGSLEHLPYLGSSLFVLLTFVAIPPIMLIVPSIKHCLYKIRSNSNKYQCNVHSNKPSRCLKGGNEKVDQFLKAFYGCYKDGTGGDIDGKIDYRWFAGLYFILRVVMLALYAFPSNWVIQIVSQQITCILTLLTILIFRPYKNDLYNKVDAIFFGILSLLCSLSLQNYYSSVVETELPIWTFAIQYILFSVPLLYIIAYIIFWIIRKVYNKYKRTVSSEDNDLCDILETADSKQAEIEINPYPLALLKSDSSQALLTNEQRPSLDFSPSTNSNSLNIQLKSSHGESEFVTTYVKCNEKETY